MTGNNGVPGAIWAQYPPSTSGAGSTVCADDTGNRNAGTKIQAFQCEQDLADQWIQVSKQLVHNGDCMTNDGGGVKLEKCEPGQRPAHRPALWGHRLRPGVEGSRDDPGLTSSVTQGNNPQHPR